MSNATKLQELISQDRSTEVQCGKFLSEIAHFLVPQQISASDVLMSDSEERSRVGDSDFVVSVKIDSGSVFPRHIAYVWELKAPQKYLFKLDRAENRVQPSDDLYGAENQLLNYVSELSGSKNFRAKYGVEGTLDDIRPGGIIIGRNDRVVKATEKEQKAALELARLAYATREAYFWAPSGIKVHTWDWVLKQLRMVESLAIQGTSAKPGKKDSGQLPSPGGAEKSSFGFLQLAMQNYIGSNQAELRLSAIAAFAAVEEKLTVGGFIRNARESTDVFRVRFVRADLDFKYRRLRDIRNRSVHLFSERIMAEDVSYALSASQEICSYLEKEGDGKVVSVGPD